MLELPDSSRILLAVVLIGYVVGLLVVSIYATGRVKNEEDYLVAGRKLPLFLAWGTLLATWFGADSMLIASEEARKSGVIGTALDPFACGAALILAGVFFAKPLWEMKLLTMSDFYRQKYGTKAEILGSCIQVPGYFGWITSQYVALAAVQEAYFGIPMWVGILIAASITLVYTMIGGMWSVTLTDTLQLIVALVGLIILAAVAFNHLGEGSVVAGFQRLWRETPSEHLTIFPSGSPAVVLGWFGIWTVGLFGNLPGQDLQQRVFASKSPGTARWACILAGIVYLLFGLVPVSLGLISKITHPGNVEGNILIQLAGNYLSTPMMIVFTVSMVSIILSTATSAVLAPASILGHNLFARLRIFNGHHLLMERLSVLLVSAGGVGLYFWSDQILELLKFSLSFTLVGLFVPMVMAMYGKPRGELSALLSMSLGTVVWLVRYFFELSVPLPEGLEIDYHVYLQTVVYPVEQAGSFVHALVGAWGFVPADLLGLGASFVGYFLGQHLARTPLAQTAGELANNAQA
jgi:solute:Na+ symporter, SSS family